MEYHGEQDPASRTDNSLNRRVEISLRLPERQVARADSDQLSIRKTYTLSKLYFRPDEAILEPSSMPYLDNVANILKTYTSGLFEIRGLVNWEAPPVASADSGYKKKMDELSTARARLVYEILIDKGIPPERMRYKGMGNSQMLYPYASTDEEKRKNMRVEILILTKQKQTH
ncbi:MAG TPA: OmpA family protein [Puia sp.]|jgi:outer membrane protein OmpA-like peptidoglycan-associated protein